MGSTYNSALRTKFVEAPGKLPSGECEGRNAARDEADYTFSKHIMGDDPGSTYRIAAVRSVEVADVGEEINSLKATALNNTLHSCKEESRIQALKGIIAKHTYPSQYIPPSAK
ncbi:hypothetical protein CISG_06577 [Coccidioides immitis RMSCC 3703]|uniref:Uncharacterized protein n=2 Tax=Coccidioides immitis TaxID=5501 RepID=A0A0J8R0T4_COCIT|nr:hypothetical protein CIRG_05871 [Coccidioides immitis RMSCC 2394]KMU78341.1 hypothetical protein CISG_06577 [Coccidioides immitis RMSCC 3703]